MKQAAKGNINMANTDSGFRPGKPTFDPKSVDFARVHMLLNTVHLCAGVGPKLTSLGNAAMTELTDLNEKIKVAAQEAERKAANERAEAEAKVRAKIEADEAAANAPPKPVLRPRVTAKPADEEADIEPNVYPGDSETATIADRRL
jgi:hypothetical protein